MRAEPGRRGERRLVQQADRGRRQLYRLAQDIRQRLLAARGFEGALQFGGGDIGPQRDVRAWLRRWPRWPRAAAPTARRCRRLRGRPRVTMASPRTDCPPNDSAMRFSGWPSKRSRNTSDQFATKPQFAGRSGAIGDAGFRQDIGPAAVGAEPRPARAAERQHQRVGMDRHAAFRRLEQHAAALVPADPMVAQLKAHAGGIEPPQPGAQQRRGLERFREHAAARSDEGLLAEALAPGAHRGGRKRLDRGAQPRRRLAVAGEEALQVLAVGEIEAAAPGQQEFPPDRRHPVVDRDARAWPASTSAAISPAGPAPTMAMLGEDDDMTRCMARTTTVDALFQSSNTPAGEVGRPTVPIIAAQRIESSALDARANAERNCICCECAAATQEFSCVLLKRIIALTFV